MVVIQGQVSTSFTHSTLTLPREASLCLAMASETDQLVPQFHKDIVISPVGPEHFDLAEAC